MAMPTHQGFSLSREIAASADRVWDVILAADTEWADAFGDGTRVASDWAEGSPILWLDGRGGVCASGVVEVIRPMAALRLRYHDVAERTSSMPLGAYTETFSLASKQADATTLCVDIAASPHLDDASHRDLWEVAIERIKERAEAA